MEKRRANALAKIYEQCAKEEPDILYVLLVKYKSSSWDHASSQRIWTSLFYLLMISLFYLFFAMLKMSLTVSWKQVVL